MNQGKVILEIITEYAGLFLSTIAYGVLITFLFMLIYVKLCLFTRPGLRVYNWIAKIWIAYFLVIGGLLSYQMAVHRCVYKAVKDQQDALVLYLYNEYMAPFVMDVALRDRVVVSVQEAYKNGERIEDSFFEALDKETPTAVVDADDFGSSIAKSLVDRYVKKYKSDVLATLLYAANEKAGERFGLHVGNEGITMEEFNGGLEVFKTAPPAEISEGVAKVLMNVVGKKTRQMDKSGRISILIMASVFLLLPLIELLVFRLLVKKGKLVPASNKADSPKV